MYILCAQKWIHLLLFYCYLEYFFYTFFIAVNNEWSDMYLNNKTQPLSILYICRYRSYGFQKMNFGNSRVLSF